MKKNLDELKKAKDYGDGREEGRGKREEVRGKRYEV